jgi:hypothetical protein
MTMSLDLSFETSRAWLVIGRGVWIRGMERTERAVEVPRANDTVATSGIPSGKKQIVTLEAVQPTWRAAAW